MHRPVLGSMGILPMFAVPRDFDRYSDRISKSEALLSEVMEKIAALLFSCPEYHGHGQDAHATKMPPNP